MFAAFCDGLFPASGLGSHAKIWSRTLMTAGRGRATLSSRPSAKRESASTQGIRENCSGSSRPLREAKRKELGLSQTDYLVLGLGRLVEQKRPFLFLRMAEELHERLPATKFIWVGDGKLADKWRRAITREKLEDVIYCTGWQIDVLPYLLASDLLLHVAEFEGLPLAVIEAMAAGLTCAVTNDLSSEVPFFNKDNVLFADDIEGLAEKLRNPLVLACIAEGGRRLVEDTLSVSKMAASYEQLYFDAKRGRSDCVFR
jgi:glycosyltransferase involved in cell wall biosynthesis